MLSFPYMSTPLAALTLVLDQHAMQWRMNGDTLEALHLFTVDGIAGAEWQALEPRLSAVLAWLGY